MVDMAVRKQDLLDRDSRLLSRGLQARQVGARVDEGAAHRRRAPQQGAILLQRRDGQDCRLERWVVHFNGSAGLGCSVAMLGGSSFIAAETCSAARMTRSTLPPASLARSWSDQPRRISSANSSG